MVDLTGHSTDGFMPHGMCYLWQPEILGLHVTSDALITLAYFSIPFTLVYFVRRRTDLEFNWMFICFAVFIVACGMTHLMEIWTVWHPSYWLSGSIKAVTALASVPTAILLVRLIPTALRLPSPATLRTANLELERQINERRKAENDVRLINEQLEARVAERTAQLEAAHRDLLREAQDRQHAQQSVLQQERLRVLGQMASGIAHDINNALAPATLYAQSLLERDSSLSGHAREYLIVIQRAIEDVAHTVSRMRDFSRTREPQLTHGTIDLNTVLRQVIELTRARWRDMPQERGIVIELKADLEPSLPPIVGAESEIRDAFTNLILNAVDAMPGGGTLTVRSRAPDDHQVLIEVTDTGTGMDEATRARCLEPFFTTKGERGTGLGLAMVYGMLGRHSGQIEIDSAPGRGTRIGISLPVGKAGEVSSGDTVASAPHAAEPMHLLVIDDDPLVLQAVRDILELEGHRVMVREGGEEGIAAFNLAEDSKAPFDAVITDLGMPHCDGRQVASAVKARAPGVPVILLTGWGQRLIEENDTPAGVDRVLSKPPRVAELRAALRELHRGGGVPRPTPL